MRWMFGNPNDAEWCSLRDEKLDAIDRWWQAFQARESDIIELFSRKHDWDLPELMGKHLQSIEPELMWEFGPGLSGGHRLVISLVDSWL